jgi:MOSC domain-containing protein YiiM/ferredoxin-NADP reductase
MTQPMHILSVNIGGSRAVTLKHRTVQTGIYKAPVAGPVPVTRLGLPGDVRIEPRKMGLEHSAVYAYPYEHYSHWQRNLDREPFPMGQFGENLTVTGMLEDEVRIGDVFRFGSAVLQVAHPRIPCAKLNERMGMRFSGIFMASRKVGFYMRVLREGSLAQGDAIELLERDGNSPTMEEFVRVTQFEYWDAQALRHLLQARDLMPAWREIIEGKLERALAASGWHGLREFELVRREQECADAVSLYLKCVRGRPLPPFHGGQQIMVVLGGSVSSQHRRPYALSGSMQDLSAYRITVRRLAAPDDTQPEGIVSSHLASMKLGDRIRCTAPCGLLMRAQERPDSDRIPVLVSQGLGIAPALSLLYEFEALNARAVLLFHESTACDPRGLLREVDALMARNPAFKLIHAGSGVQESIHVEMIRRHLPLASGDFHIAGAHGFVDRLVQELAAAGFPASALRVQRFG